MSPTEGITGVARTPEVASVGRAMGIHRGPGDEEAQAERASSGTPAKKVSEAKAQAPQADAAGAEGAPEVVSKEALEASIEKLRDQVQSAQRDLEFQVDDTTGHTVVKVMDRESGELVRQIPPKEVLQLAKRAAEQDGQGGLLLSTKI